MSRFKGPAILVITVGIWVAACYLYPEAVKIMSGDYMLSRWIVTVETNKSWLLVFFLGLVGGCTSYIVYRLVKRWASSK